ncbi:MAG: InlB B-repeat-containing protein [Clostridia bacterium]|nr:InlB B-repeat-containing protein [Clostridia bacterium]
MKQRNKILFACVFGFLLAFFLALSVGAYEPDGSASEEYEYPADECNRIVYVHCVDKDTGEIVKSVTYHTKRDVDDLISLSLYGYDITDFTSNAGLFQSCKLTWASGTGLGKYGYIQISYKFTGMISGKSITATVTVRKSEQIALIIRHYTTDEKGNDTLYQSDRQDIFYYDWVDLQALSIPGYRIKDGYNSALTGNFSYSWLGASENIGKNAFGYNYVNTPASEPMKDWSTFHEDKHGKLDYCINRTVVVNFYYTLQEYTVTYDANGGEGAPASQKKYYGVSLTLSDTVPVRGGYAFAGWATNSWSNTVSYASGDAYTENSDCTLYAVWLESEYEFSLMLWDALPSQVNRGDTVTVSIRADSWDQVHAYSGIPLELCYDGTVIGSRTLDFEPYGIAYVTFTLDVGTVAGEHTVEVRLNWENRQSETNPDNNAVSATLSVRRPAYGLSVEVLENTNNPYYEGMTVVTTYVIRNDGSENVTPENGLTARFTVSSNGTILTEQTKGSVVIPSDSSNLVYFHWTVPQDFAGKTVSCACVLDTEIPLSGDDPTDNRASFSTVVQAYPTSQTPDTRYDRTAPADYAQTEPLTSSKNTMKWNEWIWENGGFVLKRYGITFADAVSIVTPDESCASAAQENGTWVMRSGYGFSIRVAPMVTVLPGYEMPPADAYSEVQAVYATFPEFGYSTVTGRYRSLEKMDGGFAFTENPADNGKRTHFIPLYVADGDYTVSVTATQVWTPAGVLTSRSNAVSIRIKGSIYDDYYVGQ